MHLTYKQFEYRREYVYQYSTYTKNKSMPAKTNAKKLRTKFVQLQLIFLSKRRKEDEKNIMR